MQDEGTKYGRKIHYFRTNLADEEDFKTIFDSLQGTILQIDSRNNPIYLSIAESNLNNIEQELKRTKDQLILCEQQLKETKQMNDALNNRITDQEKTFETLKEKIAQKDQRIQVLEAKLEVTHTNPVEVSVDVCSGPDHPDLEPSMPTEEENMLIMRNASSLYQLYSVEKEANMINSSSRLCTVMHKNSYYSHTTATSVISIHFHVSSD